MMGRRFGARRLSLALLLLATGLAFSACEAFSSPQNTFNPAGKVAQDQKDDFLLVTWIALPIMILVLGACVAIPIMFRRRKGDPGLPRQVHGNTALELTWTIIPALLLAVIAVPTVAGISELGREPSDEALEVRVEAFRFSWQFFYREIAVDGAELESLPEETDPIQRPVLRIPVGREVAIRLVGRDVNHSFWIPKLAGKTDVIPNHENKMWILATKAGTYEGQCAEFCGLHHADMRFRVTAMPEDEFNAWVANQGGVETLGSADSTAADDGKGPGAEPTPSKPGDLVIELDDNVFKLAGSGEENPTLRVASGQVVPIRNVGNALHNMHVGPFEQTTCNASSASPCSEPPRINAGDDGEITFDVPPGTYEYRCDFHPAEMSGTLEVGPAAPGEAPAGTSGAGE